MQWKSWAFMGLPKSAGGLGFKDLVCFNQALLAKQCWRLFTDLTSLVVRVLKEKYFRNVKLFDAKLGVRPSLIWRSLKGALNLIKDGLIWRVGNGESIYIWGDRWIPKPSSFAIQSPAKHLDKTSMVVVLIDAVKGEWKADLIKDFFLAEEAEMIGNIPLSFSGGSDKQIWVYTKNGLFFVKSAYHLEMNRLRSSKADSSYKLLEGEGWNSMWSLKIPRVVQNFLWKAFNNGLPTRDNLFKRKITDDLRCPICQKETETVSHVLWSCIAATNVWAEELSPVRKWTSTPVDLLCLWQKMLDKLKLYEVELIAITMRYIWLRRNKVIFEDHFEEPSLIIQRSQQTMENFKEAHTNIVKYPSATGKWINKLIGNHQKEGR